MGHANYVDEELVFLKRRLRSSTNVVSSIIVDGVFDLTLIEVVLVLSLEANTATLILLLTNYTLNLFTLGI